MARGVCGGALRGLAVAVALGACLTASTGAALNPTPLEQQGSKLVPTALEAGPGQVGSSAALSSDGTVAVAGAPLDRDGAGAAYVYTRDAAGWHLQGQLLAGASESGAGRFGAAVAVSGDGSSILVGAPEDSQGAGAAFLFTRRNGNWGSAPAAVVRSPDAGSAFGSSVALTSDASLAVVGGPADAGGAGAAWVYMGTAPSLTLQRKLVSGDGSLGRFGTSVAVSADGTTGLVGAPADGVGYTSGAKGTAWVFFGAGLSQAGPELRGDGEHAGAFGTSVALSADGKEALIGDPLNSPTGAVWVYALSPQFRPTGFDVVWEVSGDGFGTSVALSGDGSTGLVGVPSLSGNGAGMVDQLTASWNWNVTNVLVPTDAAAASGFGTSVALSFDGSVAVAGGPADGGGAGALWPFAAAPPAPPSELTTMSTTSGKPGDVVTVGGDQLQPNTTTPNLAVIFGGTRVPLNAGSSTDAQGVLRNGSFTVPQEPPGTYSVELTDGTRTTPPFATPFTVAAAQPIVGGGGAGAVQSVSTDSATLEGTVVPNGSPTTYVVQYGTSTSYGQQTAPAPAGSSFSPQTVTATVTGLSPATTYHYRFVGTNAAGAANGPDGTFTTAAAPASGGGGGGGGGGAAPAPSPSPSPAPTPTPTPTAAPFTPPSPPAGGTPALSGELVKTVTGSSATVVATVATGGSSTSVAVEYGPSDAYGKKTAPVTVGPSSSPRTVTIVIDGLAPSVVYHYRFVATNAAGTTRGGDATFVTTTGGTGPTLTAAGTVKVPPPVQGSSANIFPYSGKSSVSGKPLLIAERIRFGTHVDATHGIVTIRTIVGGVVQQMEFYGGKFFLTQAHDGTTVLKLEGGNRTRSCKPTTRKGPRMTQGIENAHTVRSLWGNGHGKFQIKGHYAAATVRGTWFHVADRCDGTLVHVRRGIVAVLNTKAHRTVFVIAGQSYLVLSSGLGKHS